MARPARLIDAHIHLFDFLQETDGIHSLVERMDEARVDRAVIFGMPVVKKWNACEPLPPHYYLDDNARCYYYALTDQLVVSALQSLPPEQQDRFAPLMSGFNPTDRNGVRHLERMWRLYPHWRGVGEVLLRHDDLTNLTLDETARANHPAMTPVYEFCEGLHLPILLHQNSNSISSALGSVANYAYLHELEEVLSRHPKLTVVWAHCGLSRRVRHDRYHEMIERLLREHPRLCLDISWLGYDEVMCQAGAVRPEWLSLFERYADRVVLGSDLVGHFETLRVTLTRYEEMLDRLSESSRDKVMHATAERIFFGSGGGRESAK